MLSEKLKELRNLKGYTQKEVALLLDFNRVTYTNYEHGVSEPNISTLKKLASIFDVSIDYLLDYNISSTKTIKKMLFFSNLKKNILKLTNLLNLKYNS